MRCNGAVARQQVVLKTLVLFHRLMQETFPGCTRFTQKCVAGVRGRSR